VPCCEEVELGWVWVEFACPDVDVGCPEVELWVEVGALWALLEPTSHGLEGRCEVVCHETPGGTGDAPPVVLGTAAPGLPVTAPATTVALVPKPVPAPVPAPAPDCGVTPAVAST